ncbi:VMAP-C domain-containing protein [Streptomyces lydicus]|uniref:VMAP-C domain-containing protein n=1 Tax=Streptomyces lydicus TaxID=47763 RepID=UPI00372029E3
MSLQRAMVEVLAGSPRLASHSGRRALVRMLAQLLDDPLSEPDAQARSLDQFSQLVAECTALAEGADALADAVGTLTGDLRTTRELRLLCDRWSARTWLAESELLALEGLLSQVPSDDVQVIAQASLQPLASPLPVHCTHAWSILLHLLRRNALPNGLPPFMAFLEYLAAAVDDGIGEQIRSWTFRHAQASGLLPSLRECRKRATSIQLPDATDRRVMFVLMPDGLSSDYYVLRVWHDEGGAYDGPPLRDDDTRVRETEIARAVTSRLRHALVDGQRTDLTVEFWLPLALVNEPVWEWCRPAGEQEAAWDCRVLVRSLDRLQSPDSHSSWRERWMQLMREDVPAAPCPGRRETEGAARRSGEPLVLNSPPDVEDGRRELMDAIHAGAPAILWHRQNCSQSFHESVQNLIHRGPLKDLPSRIGEIHLSPGPLGDEAELLREVTLMWDDPDRQLPVLRPLVAPDEVAAP